MTVAGVRVLQQHKAHSARQKQEHAESGRSAACGPVGCCIDRSALRLVVRSRGPGDGSGDVGVGDGGEYDGDIGEYDGDVGEYAGDIGEYVGDAGLEVYS